MLSVVAFSSFCLLIVDVFIFKGLWSCYRGGDWCKPWVCTSWSRKLLVFASYVVYTLHKLFLLPKYAVSVFLEQVCRFVKASISWFSPTIEHRYTCILWTNSGINTFSTFFFCSRVSSVSVIHGYWYVSLWFKQHVVLCVTYSCCMHCIVVSLYIAIQDTINSSQLNYCAKVAWLVYVFIPPYVFSPPSEMEVLQHFTFSCN